MKVIRLAAATLFLLFVSPCFAYISCTAVKVKIQSATGASFNNFSEVGVVGATVFTPVDTANCTNSEGTPFSGTAFLVLAGVGQPGGLTQFWLSMFYLRKRGAVL